MTTNTDMLKHANRRKRERSLASRGSCATLHDDLYQFLSWDVPLRWIKLVTWLLVIVVVLWDIVKTFGRHIGQLN